MTPPHAPALPGFSSLLFVPGNAPARFEKALATPAAVVCLDLEDAVPAEAKAEARANVLAHLADSPDRARLCVRVNRLGSAEGMEDLAAFARASALPGMIMMPKVESARDAELFGEVFRDATAPHLIALLESPLGVEAAFDIARCPPVSGLLFGSFDYSAEAGCTQEWSVLMPVRSRIVAAAASAGKLVIDSPFSALDDVDAAAAEARLVQSLGFTGKAAIHPKFIPGINDAFTPTEAEIAEAKAMLAAFESAGQGAARIGGKLVEAPVVRRMQRLLDRAADLVKRGAS